MTCLAWTFSSKVFRGYVNSFISLIIFKDLGFELHNVFCLSGFELWIHNVCFTLKTVQSLIYFPLDKIWISYRNLVLKLLYGYMSFFLCPLVVVLWGKGLGNQRKVNHPTIFFFYSFFYLTNIYYLLCTKHCVGQ